MCPKQTVDPATLNLRHLWAFCQVAEHRSINRVAGWINLSQPAISQGIFALEQAFDATLFNRDTSGMHPTRMGGLLAARVRRGFKALEMALALGDAQAPNSTPRGDDPSVVLRTNQLSVLVALIGNGGIAGCAGTLGISEKSVARNLRNLELRLGRSLLIRDVGLIRLTSAGEAIARAARIFFREIELACEEMSAEVGISNGRLVIGGLPLVRSYILPRAMVEIATRFPDVDVQLVEGSHEILLAGVRDGEIDILVGALRGRLPAEDVQQIHLFDERLCVVARSDHPIFHKPHRDLSDTMAYSWIAPRTGSPAREVFDGMMARAERAPSILLEVASHIAVRSILVESDCLALISRHQIRYEELGGQLSVVLIDAGQGPRHIGVTVRKDWDPTPLQQAFLEALDRAAQTSLSPELSTI